MPLMVVRIGSWSVDGRPAESGHRDVDSIRLAGYHTRMEDRQSRLMAERTRIEK
jgi:hypothetical protein